MATAPEIARLVEGAGDFDEVIARLTAAGLSVADSGNHILVSGTVAVANVGSNTRANAYWIVYDVHNPSKSKLKVSGRNPDAENPRPPPD